MTNPKLAPGDYCIHRERGEVAGRVVKIVSPPIGSHGAVNYGSADVTTGTHRWHLHFTEPAVLGQMIGVSSVDMQKVPADFPLQVAAFLDELSKDNSVNNGERVLENVRPHLTGTAGDVAEVNGDPDAATWVLRINGNVVVTAKAQPPFIAFRELAAGIRAQKSESDAVLPAT